MVSTSLAHTEKIHAGAMKKGEQWGLLNIGQRVAKKAVGSFLTGNFNLVCELAWVISCLKTGRVIPESSVLPRIQVWLCTGIISLCNS